MGNTQLDSGGGYRSVEGYTDQFQNHHTVRMLFPDSGLHGLCMAANLGIQMSQDIMGLAQPASPHINHVDLNEYEGHQIR